MKRHRSRSFGKGFPNLFKRVALGALMTAVGYFPQILARVPPISYARNVALCPIFRTTSARRDLRCLRSGERTIHSFCLLGRRFKHGNPNAEVHFFDTGHFALETHYHEFCETIGSS